MVPEDDMCDFDCAKCGETCGAPGITVGDQELCEKCVVLELARYRAAFATPEVAENARQHIENLANLQSKDTTNER